MTHQHEYDLYMRGNAIISLRDQGNAPRGFALETVKQKIRDTLDCLPTSHINLFGTNGNIRLGNIPSTGGGHDPNIPHIRLSYDCFNGARNHSYNNGRLSYTLLHEMGHIVDKSINPSCMSVLKREYPLGCLAIITRYHGGATSGFSEHYADIYADYFYNEVGGLVYGVNRSDNSIRQNGQHIRCGGGCNTCASWLRLLANMRLPRGHADLTALRYNALFQSPPFLSIDRGMVYQAPSFGETINQIIRENGGYMRRTQESTLPVGRKPGVIGH